MKVTAINRIAFLTIACVACANAAWAAPDPYQRDRGQVIAAVKAAATRARNNINGDPRTDLATATTLVLEALVDLREELKQKEALGEIGVTNPQGNYADGTGRPRHIVAVDRLLQMASTAEMNLAAGRRMDAMFDLIEAWEAAEVAWYQFDGRRNDLGVGVWFNVVGDRAYMTGVIDGRIGPRLNAALAKGVKTIVMVNVPGSDDDAQNLRAAKLIHQRGLNTHVVTGGGIASGGVDFFLAGKQRTAGDNVFVDVHSWAEGAGGSGFSIMQRAANAGNRKAGRNNPAHRSFTDYYSSINIDPEFYWFTLGFRPEDMHTMTTSELKQFGILTPAARVDTVASNSPGTSGTKPAKPQPDPNKPKPDPNKPKPSGSRPMPGGGSVSSVLGIDVNVRGDGGLTVTRLDAANLPVAKPELQVGDVIYLLNDRLIGNLTEIKTALAASNQASIRVYRGGNLVLVQLTPPKPEPKGILGSFTEIRTDTRQQKEMTFKSDGTFTEHEKNRLTWSGTYEVADGELLKLRGRDGESEMFLFEIVGNRVNFMDMDENRIKRFHWIRK